MFSKTLSDVIPKVQEKSGKTLKLGYSILHTIMYLSILWFTVSLRYMRLNVKLKKQMHVC